MRILLIHSRYLQGGGEDVVVKLEAELLGKINEVRRLEISNRAGLAGMVQFVASIWNIAMGRKLARLLQEFRPDIIHLHNWHFATGPVVIRIARKYKIPIVHTIHNYRLICPSATLTVDGKLFLDCISAKFPFKAIRFKAYRNSYLQTAWLACIVWLHKKTGTWNMIDRFIVPSAQITDIFLAAGFPVDKHKFVIKPNFVFQIATKQSTRNGYYLYVGRLSREKGIPVLLEAFKGSDRKLIIVGEGPMAREVDEAVKENANITYQGQLGREEVSSLIGSCKALLFPSVWYETFGLVIIEAFSTGTVVIASNIGAASGIVKHGVNGFHVDPGNAADLKAKLLDWECLQESEKEKMRVAASISYTEAYTPQQNLDKLMDIYNNCVIT